MPLFSDEAMNKHRWLASVIFEYWLAPAGFMTLVLHDVAFRDDVVLAHSFGISRICPFVSAVDVSLLCFMMRSQ